MSVIALGTAKNRLHVIHTADDVDLQQALDGAEREGLRFMGRTTLPTESGTGEPRPDDPVSADVVEGILLLVKSSYEATTPAEIEGYRKAAEIKLFPYRALGV